MGYKSKGGTAQTFLCDSLLANNTPCGVLSFILRLMLLPYHSHINNAGNTKRKTHNATRGDGVCVTACFTARWFASDDGGVSLFNLVLS